MISGYGPAQLGKMWVKYKDPPVIVAQLVQLVQRAQLAQLGQQALEQQDLQAQDALGQQDLEA